MGVQNQSVDNPFIYGPAGTVLDLQDFNLCVPVLLLTYHLSHPDCCAFQGRAAFRQPSTLGPAPRVAGYWGNVRNGRSLVRSGDD